MRNLHKIKLPFWVAPISDMFQRQIDNLFHVVPIVFGTADDILIADINELGRDHDEAVDKVLKLCRKANLKPYEEK